MFSKMQPHRTLKERAVKVLSEAILLGKIKPGQHLNESELHRKLHISRAPIREALQQLQEQGLITNVPRRGMFVVSLKDENVQKINSLRLVLEAEALRLARKNITDKGKQKLRHLLKKMERSRPAPTNESVRVDMEFHRLIWSTTGNEYLEKMLTSLTAPLFAHAMLTYLREDKQRLVLDSHRPLAQYVLGDSDQTAEEVMLAHLSLRWHDPVRFSSLQGSSAKHHIDGGVHSTEGQSSAHAARTSTA